ncbi:hypothetical protein [Roseococcus pinisoli]|uniref:Uncharacterized protein n=1 Tax=Roseococcus pinisoli TaxID=2835040 RepID=A0ABS5QFP7_9PROT|nr:hypothetical protein [Roseococcus pinisoli]MBS7812323.1 hypothetical protein [Roseococcus pinisoli]
MAITKKIKTSDEPNEEAVLHSAAAKASIEVKHPDGSTTTKDEPVGGAKLFKEPPCTVGFTLGCTIPLAPYTSGRAEVSLSVPCGHGEINKVYDFAKKWVEDRMETVSSELAASMAPTT